MKRVEVMPHFSRGNVTPWEATLSILSDFFLKFEVRGSVGVKSSVQESNTEVLARSQTLIVDQESRCFPLMSTVLIFFFSVI